MLTKIISGGQTGADQAGWRAAKRFNLETSGWMPRGFKTEDGPRPEFARLYGATEHPSSDYRNRTISNVGLAEATVIFNRGARPSPGTILALNTCREVNQPVLVVGINVDSSPTIGPHSLKAWIIRNRATVLNVAGNRESSSPGIGAWVESYLCEVLRLLGLEEVDGDDRIRA